MKKFILLYFAILLLLIGVHHSYAFNVTARNTTDRTLIYELIWIDCDWWPDGQIKPCQQGMAEMKPGAVFKQENRNPGKYLIIWDQPSHLKHTQGEFKEIRMIIEITEEKGLLQLSPTAPPLFLKGS
jgi:hypothetical protein